MSDMTSDKSDTVDLVQSKQSMLEALEATAGIVTTACDKANISRDSHYRWLKEDSAYKSAVRELENIALDLAESKLLEKVREGHFPAVKFLLRTRGKFRGYVDSIDEQLYLEHRRRKEREEEEDKNLDYSKLTPEELDMFDKLLDKASTLDAE